MNKDLTDRRVRCLAVHSLFSVCPSSPPKEHHEHHHHHHRAPRRRRARRRSRRRWRLRPRRRAHAPPPPQQPSPTSSRPPSRPATSPRWSRWSSRRAWPTRSPRAGPYTVFAPTDAAFKKVPKKTLKALGKDKAKLKAVLLYHVASGRLAAKRVVKRSSIKTLNGKRVKIRVRGRNVFVNRSKVVTADVRASNGIIHVDQPRPDPVAAGGGAARCPIPRHGPTSGRARTALACAPAIDRPAASPRPDVTRAPTGTLKDRAYEQHPEGRRRTLSLAGRHSATGATTTCPPAYGHRARRARAKVRALAVARRRVRTLEVPQGKGDKKEIAGRSAGPSLRSSTRRKRPRSRRRSRVRRFRLIPRTSRQPRVVQEVRVGIAPLTR